MDDGLLLVGEDRGNRGLWIGLAGIGLGGLLLFTALEANRQSSMTPDIPPPRDFAVASTARPELAIPGDHIAERPPIASVLQPTGLAVPLTTKLPPVRLTRVRPATEQAVDAVQPPAPGYALPPPPQSTAPDPGRSAPTIVYDAFQGVSSSAPPTNASASQSTKAMAVGGGDRSYLVAQGTLIYAVLETALNSTQSGQARAMVSTPVYNALGTQILIPKGSRLFGEYKGDIAAGQNRAQVIWTRLIRPDGATIALDSPASDQLGRAGVKGSVNTHFGERLLGALLQSTIDFGAYAASRAVTSGNGVVVALPTNGVQNAASELVPPPPKPTLKVRHGTRIAVFVARDLDFSAVE
jgi:type IV secretion system protein VirB10